MANVRVYELARELGLSNKETLDLCDALGIGAKSHSSSIVEAQADRVRRKAEREGLIRDEQPEEDKPKKKAPATRKRPAIKKSIAPVVDGTPIITAPPVLGVETEKLSLGPETPAHGTNVRYSD